MKKIILSVAVICMMAVASVSAQDFSWGAKVGINLANLSGDEGDDYNKSRLGYVVGLASEYKFSDATSLSVDVLYSSQGDRYKDGDYRDSARLGYLNIPVLFNYYICEGFAVKAGIQPGFLISSKWAENDNGEKDSIKTSNYYNTFDFAIPIGLSYDLSETIVLDARYNIGVSNVIDGGGSSYKGTNNVFQLTMGYKF